MSTPLEIEVKLGLPSEAVHDALLAALAATGAAARLRRQRNRFFDGPQGELSAARIALRLREERCELEMGEQVRSALTLKRSGSTSGAVHERIEWEAVISLTLAEVEAEPSLLLSRSEAPSVELRRLVPGLTTLVCLGGFENERREVFVSLQIDDGGGQPQAIPTIWEVDRTRFSPGPVEHELEVELPPAARALAISADALAVAVQARLAELGVAWCPQPDSKYARFRRYVLGHED